MNRRIFFGKSLLGAGGVLAFSLAYSTPQHEKTRTDQLTPPKVIFFDVNETLLNLEPLKKSVTEVLGGRKELVSL